MMLLSHNLQAFLAVVRNSTVMAAAKDLGLTQTGVTQRIKSLERDIGVALFVRSRKGMSMTPEGEAVLQYCLQAEELEGRLASRIGRAGMESRIDVTISGPTSMISSRVVPQCSPLYKKWPQLNINYLVVDSENRIGLLKTGKADLVILRPRHVVNEVDSKRLAPDEYLLVGHPQWRNRKIGEILANERIIDFDKDDPTTLEYLKACRLPLTDLRPRIYANENRALIELLCAGVGYGTLTRSIAADYLSNGSLVPLNGGKSVREALALAWYARTELPAYFKDLIDAIV